MNKNFSKRIKKRLKKRKKIQKLKELLKLQKLKINKNLIELYLNQIMQKKNLKTKIDSNIINQNLHANTTYSSSLKIIVSESFQIKSSYNNINLLTKGEVIRNQNYKLCLENLIKQSLIGNIINEGTFKSNYSTKTQNNKQRKFKMVKFKTGIENDSKNNNTFLFDKISSKYKQSLKTSRNHCLNITEQNDKNKKFYRLLEKDFEDIGNLKLYENKKAQKTKHLKDNKKEGKDILLGKKIDKKKSGYNRNDSCKNITDKIIISTLNALNEYEKDSDKNKDNKFEYLNQQNLNSYEKIVKMNNLEEKKTSNCLVF